MKTTYENTIISTGISQIELRTIPTVATIPTGEDGYEPMRFTTNRTDSPPQTLKEHGVISWKLAVLIVVIALAVSVISSLITGAIVYGKAKTYQDELSEITNTNINDLDRRLNYTLSEKQLLENQLNGSNWDPWSNWGSCTVECGGGLRLRSRQCNENVCVGNNQEVELCNIDKCTVHGGWSLWSAWGRCSVTCGVGLMRRDRTCSNPYPDLNGDHCFGDSRDDRACFKRACADGSWSQWTNWGSCSASCGGGLKIRTRTCNNPSPSQFGKDCDGNNEVNVLCNTKPCPVPMVAFTAHSPTGTLVGDSTPTFRTIVENSGGGYDKATGVFTCTVPGLYNFYVNLLVSHSPSTGYTYCYIFHNASAIVRAWVESGSLRQRSGSASIYLHLSAADTVHLRCGNWNNISTSDITMFTGALITAE